MGKKVKPVADKNKDMVVGHAVANPIDVLSADIKELQGDLLRIVELLGAHFGGEFTEKAKEILNKRQGA